MSDPKLATLHEIQTVYSLVDVISMHIALDEYSNQMAQQQELPKGPF